MGHPAIENLTPYAFAPLFLVDEELRPLFVAVVKATFGIRPQGLALEPEQSPVNLVGEHWGEPASSSYRFEPECAFVKLATDVVLLGQAYAPKRGSRDSAVTLQVGPLRKSVRVVGDRVFFRSMGSTLLTDPAPFETIPLRWERAFGGWDRSAPDPSLHGYEPRNPVGLGFRVRTSAFQEGIAAPNIEDPARPFQGWGDRPPPVGFGFVSPQWEPRAGLAGTYDAAWDQQRKPLLPSDFDRRHFNAAPIGLVASGYLRGDEEVVVLGATPSQRLMFRLPGPPPPRVTSRRSGEDPVALHMNLDTVIIDLDHAQVLLLWRGFAALETDPTELSEIRVGS